MNSRKNDYALPELELNTEFDVSNSESHFVVLIKHDYYSQNNEHGRKLLSSFLDVLCDDSNRISKILVIDSGVNLLNPDNELNSNFMNLLKIVTNVSVCKDSLEFYGLDSSEFDYLSITSAYNIAAEILNSDYLITIE